jgi:predicted  nucleic acid-binding Zn-ribbon protein
MSRAAALYHLQQVDLKLDGLRRELAAVAAQLVESPALLEARAALAADEDSLAGHEKRQRALEGELQVLIAKIAEVEQRLYGGKVGNPKELAELQKDVAALGRRRQALEDDELAEMLAIDEGRAAVQAAHARLAAVEAQWRHDQQDLLAERARLETLVAAVREERAMSARPVPADDLALYQSLRPRKGGQAVGVLRDGTCSACGVAPSAARVAGARSDDALVRCGNCERILYVDSGHFIADEEL